MENVSDTPWDVVISGTGLQQSLLALALSRSSKKVLHVDPNDYYGSSEAAFSLQEVEQWVSKIEMAALPGPFSNASLWIASTDDESIRDSEKLSFSRAYTFALAPQIIYSRSKLLSQLVSSKVYKQLEFQAVGNWWLYNAEATSIPDGSADNTLVGKLARIPNGREDVFSDNGIDVRAKRNLMKFLKFVVDYENQATIWKPYAESSLPEFLSVCFNILPSLQTMILALTLSIALPAETTVQYSLPRIARHLTSIGVFGPGFGAVIPKWGGASEIAQVACRAGAVGGAVYMLGTGVAEWKQKSDSHVELTFTDGEAIRSLVNSTTISARTFVTDARVTPDMVSKDSRSVSKLIAVLSSDLQELFVTAVEGSPTPAVSIIAFPSNSTALDGQDQPQPIYVMAHTSETGECPAGQCILYASTLTTSNAKARLEGAISSLIASVTANGYAPKGTMTESARRLPRVLYSVYYEQNDTAPKNVYSGRVCSLASSSLDLAFDDTTVDNVEDAWKMVMALTADDNVSQGDVRSSYMMFSDRVSGQADDE